MWYALMLIAIALLAMPSLGAKDLLHVHLVCHSHNDLGWLKTVDEYYYGINQGISHAGAKSQFTPIV
jgi:hypothetical protein